MTENIYTAPFLGEKFIESVREPAAIFDGKKNLIKMNGAMAEALGGGFDLASYVAGYAPETSGSSEAELCDGSGMCYKIYVREIAVNENESCFLVTSENITELKRLKRVNLRDRMYRLLVLPDIIGIIEADLTAGKVDSFDAGWLHDEPGTAMSYEDAIDATRARVSAAYREDFAFAMSRENLLFAYKRGEDVLRCEYLWKSKGGYVWVRVTASMVEDKETGDINVLLCINDIDREKQESQHWIDKAERDALTGLYNRSTATGEIERFLARPGSKRLSALLMIDIDDFKGINDTYGHMFGDAVLTELGAKIRAVFRENDVLCRLGGDEFIIFMKNIDQVESAEKKAQELCLALDTTFTSGQSSCHITCSIGIAFAPTDGRQFEDLYNRADAALYGAKRQGKNKWVTYSKELDEIQEQHEKQKEIRPLWRTSFSNSIDEHVFKVLYESKDLDTAIPGVLEFLSKHFDFTEAFILEAGDNRALHVAYEWNETGNAPLSRDRAFFAGCDVKNYFSDFDENGIMYANADYSPSETVAQILSKTGAKSGLQFAYQYGGRYAGALGFVDARKNREFTAREIDELRMTAQIISIFILHAQTSHILRQQLKAMRVTLDRYETPVIIVGADSRRLSFVNKAAQKRWPHIKIGDACYKMYLRDAPCDDCPIEVGSYTEGKEAVRVERSSTEEDYCIIWLYEDGAYDEAVVTKRV